MAMNKQRKTSNVLNILNYDDAGNIVIKDYGQATRYSWNGTIHGFIGQLSVSSVSASVTDTDKFLVYDGGVLRFRTGAEVLSDIGGQPAGSYVTTARTLTINGTAFDLSANRSWSVGTVTTVAALTLGTSGTDLSSTVTNGTTTPVITLQIPTASATNRGALSSIDWATFNSKQAALTLTTTGTSGAATLLGDTLNIPQYSGNNIYNADGTLTAARTLTLNSQPLTIAGTTSSRFFANGNVGIGTTTDAGERLQVTSSTGDNHLVVWGTSAPSIRINNAGSSATQRFVFGLATATNNFITGAVAGDICMTTQSSNPLLFGANALEVMRITTSRNLLVGTSTDYGEKLVVDGTTRLRSYTGIGINADLSTMLYVQGSGTTSADFSAVFQNSNFDNLMKIHNNGKINMGYLPTSATGLAAGDIWNNGGVLNIV